MKYYVVFYQAKKHDGSKRKAWTIWASDGFLDINEVEEEHAKNNFYQSLNVTGFQEIEYDHYVKLKG